MAAAVRHESASVDAVEIDPGILALGRTPSRTSLQRTAGFGPCDRCPRFYEASPWYLRFGAVRPARFAHQLSDYSNMRIDNFVYTKESFQEAQVTAGSGRHRIHQISGESPLAWEAARRNADRGIRQAARRFCGRLELYAPELRASLFPRPDKCEHRLAADPALSEFVTRESSRFSGLCLPCLSRPTTGPIFISKGDWIPRHFRFCRAFLCSCWAAIFYRQIPEARQRVPSLFFFSMGAGFLLLETQVVSRLALYFGTTWQVNGIVIGAILVALLVANAIVERQTKPWPRHWYLGGLLAGLLVTYIFPFHRLPGSPTIRGLGGSGRILGSCFLCGAFVCE